MRHDLSALALALALVASMLAVSGAAAQQPLAEFIQSSSEHALDARQARASLQQANAGVELARARLLPSVQAGAQYARNEYLVQFDNFLMPGGDPITIQAQDQLQANLSINVPLIDIAGWAGYFQNEAAASAVDAQADVALQNVHVAVVQLWHQLVSARALAEAATQSVEVAQHALANVEARLEMGMAAELDHARAIAEVERARQVVAETQLQATLAANNLKNLTGLEPIATAAVLEDDQHEEQPLDQFLAHVDDLPMVVAAHRQRSAADTGQTAAWLNFLPTVAGQFTERATNAAGFAPRTQWTMTLNASWGLDWGRAANVMAQDAIAAGVDVQIDRAEQQAATAIFEAWHRVRAAIAQLQSAIAAEAASDHAFDNASARFEAGVGTQIEQIQAQRDRFSARVARIQATANLRVARAALRLNSGMGVE